MKNAPTRRTIAAAIRQRRVELGLSQNDLARRCGEKWYVNYVSKTELSKRDLTALELFQLADALETTADELRFPKSSEKAA